MVCPSCGKQVAATEALCRFCGAAVDHPATPSFDSLPPAGRGPASGASEEMSRQRRDATACLLLGILSFATLPVVFALAPLRDRLRDSGHVVLSAVMVGVMAGFFVSAIPAGVLAVVLGRRANKAIRRIEGRIFGDNRAKPGMVLGAIGAGFWSLLVVISLILPKHRFDHGVSAVGSLRTINTAAITYASQYGHGYPLKLSYLGCDPSIRNDQAAGFIDERLASGTVAGYRFYYVAGPVDSKGKILTYTIHADPIDPSGGHLYYFTDQTGVVRRQSKWEANVSSPPVDWAGSAGHHP